MKYRIFLQAEKGEGKKQLIVGSFSYQVTGRSLSEVWTKYNRVFRGRSVILKPGARQIKASDLGKEPTIIGYATDGLYLLMQRFK